MPKDFLMGDMLCHVGRRSGGLLCLVSLGSNRILSQALQQISKLLYKLKAENVINVPSCLKQMVCIVYACPLCNRNFLDCSTEPAHSSHGRLNKFATFKRVRRQTRASSVQEYECQSRVGRSQRFEGDGDFGMGYFDICRLGHDYTLWWVSNVFFFMKRSLFTIIIHY